MKLIILAAVLLNSAALAQQIRYDYDRSADFSNLKTYKWVALRNSGVGDPLVDRDIRSAIENELNKKGMTKVEGDAAVLVAYQASVGREKQLEAWGSAALGWDGASEARNDQHWQSRVAACLVPLSNCV